MRNITVKCFAKKVAACLAAACILAMGPGTAYAASAANIDAVSVTSGTGIAAQGEELEEYIDTTPDGDTVIEMGEVLENARATGKSFSWTLGGNTLKYTGYFWASKSKQIKISASVLPLNKTVYVGLVEPNGTKRFVYVTNSATHTFSLDQTGLYKVYVRNAGSTSASVTGTYAVVD